jgi:hypothetical protein
VPSGQVGDTVAGRGQWLSTEWAGGPQEEVGCEGGEARMEGLAVPLVLGGSRWGHTALHMTCQSLGPNLPRSSLWGSMDGGVGSPECSVCAEGGRVSIFTTGGKHSRAASHVDLKVTAECFGGSFQLSKCLSLTASGDI